ncbi:hypothetical protein D9M68_746780 [compost metagenome]
MVGQVREAVGTLGVGAVAHRAVGREHAAAHFQGFRILGHFLDRHGGVLGEDRTVFLIGLVHLLFPLVYAGPAAFAVGERLAIGHFVVAGENALPVAQARVHDQVAGGEDQGADEQHEPPLGQRVVIFLDAVEGMAESFFGAFLTLALAGGEDQPGQCQQGEDGEQGYVPAPERSHSLLLLEACSSRLEDLGGSSAKGRLAASSKLLLRLLL